MKKTIFIVAISVTIIVLLYGVITLAIFDTSAKYINYNEMNHYYESTELYISSNNLSETEDKYNIINHYDFYNIDFEIKNSISSNQITNYNINYEIECNILENENNNYKCILDNTEDNKITKELIANGTCIDNEKLSYEECILQEYNYKLEETINKHQFKIIENKINTNNKIEVELTLKTTSPFSKTLKAIYILNLGESNNNTISIDNITNYDTFCEYTIYNNYNEDKTIKINIDENKLIFDNTDYVFNNKIHHTLNENNIIESITININKLSNQELILYKHNFNDTCDKNNINIIIEE